MSDCIIYRGDCRPVLVAFADATEAERPAMILVDPAYKISSGGRNSNLNGKKVAGHPTEKPVGLMRQLIEAHVAPGEMVFDPMMGAGSTGIAALICGRRFVTDQSDMFERIRN